MISQELLQKMKQEIGEHSMIIVVSKVSRDTGASVIMSGGFTNKEIIFYLEQMKFSILSNIDKASTSVWEQK